MVASLLNPPEPPPLPAPPPLRPLGAGARRVTPPLPRVCSPLFVCSVETESAREGCSASGVMKTMRISSF